MAVNHINFILRCQRQKTAPVGNQLKQWRNLYEFVVLSDKMCFGTTPSVILGVLHQFCRNRIHFDISSCCQQVFLIHGKRSKSFLPQMSSPVFTKIDPPGITTMSFADSTGESLFAVRHGDKMNMIRHQAPGPDLDMILAAPLRHQLDIS